LTLPNLFRDRRSIRRYGPQEVPEEALTRILEAARWAPSAHNAQPWRFIVIRGPSTKQRLAEAMADRWDRDMAGNGVAGRVRERLIEDSIRRFSGAPVVIVACLTMEEMDRYPDRRRRGSEHLMAVQSAAAAVENMLLATHVEGLGSCWYSAPLFCQATVRRVLGAPPSVDPQALITMGYPAERPPPPPRKPLGEVVHRELWGR